MQSLLRFMRSLRGRSAWHSSVSHTVGAVLSYTGRCIALWRQHDAWLAFLESPAMAGIPSIDTVLVERYQHRYISKAWSKQRRLKALRDHYDFVLARFPRPLFHTLYREREVTLGTVPLRDGDVLTLVMKAPYRRGREGEMSLALVDSAGLQISYAQFSIINGGTTLVIGCLQGAANNAGLDAVRDMTRQCHGLRPKNLLLSLVRTLADAFGVEHVLGIANGTHVFAGLPGKIKADYDAFWLEAGGVPTDDGFYAIQAREPVRSAMDVESKRRSEFRRREALRHEACERVLTAFGIERVADIPLAA